jgi:hypothetical protein
MLSSCGEKKIDFSAQVKPILNKHCISCHGGVKRSGDFSVLFRHEALDTTESGKPAIIPFDAKHSEMIRRLTLTNPEERMPLKEEPLTQEEIDVLTRWIDEGAEWGDHWAYVPPADPQIPDAEKLTSSFKNVPNDWPRSPIDNFVLAALQKQALEPSPQADRTTLLRRVYFDITGTPPTPEQVQRFMADQSPQAYEKVVDELLGSPHYGEKWASWWLDLARYSDTKGYERDVARSIWRYRDWVINSFNQDMPFDQFTTEQLAGDLLPNPTDEQLIATAFHRNTMNNDEGGTEDEEFRVAALIDRVNTTWEVWQSTTMACVQCHTHPYDPFVHDEYYKSMAFFNNTRDEDTEADHPTLRTYMPEDQKKVEAIRSWVLDNSNSEVQTDVTRFLKTLEPKYHAHNFDKFVNGDLIDTKWLGISSGGSARLKQINLTGKTHLIISYWGVSDGHASLKIRKDSPDGEEIAAVKLPATGNRLSLSIPLKASSGKHDLYFVFSNPAIPAQQRVCAIDWFAFREDLPGKGKPQYASMEKSFMELLNTQTANTTPIMIESNPEQHRTTNVFERGNWLVKGKAVNPEVPESLNPFPQGQPANRLGFSKWLMDKKNPLTSRTIVNRFWEQLFGYGLVETLEDFGTQGAAPSNQEILDWLALRFMNDYQWSVKKLIREIVLSSTYRQDSRVTKELYEKDQTNRYLARGPRVRLPAEAIRDQALAVAGLLSDKMYGPSVMPYQPAGIWNSVWSGAYWKTSSGEDQYRRSVYTFNKRTSPYPSMIMFDGSSREVCLSRRIRTNTPLQALVTMNDSTFIMASRSFADRMRSSADKPEAQINAGYKILLGHDIADTKLNILVQLYKEALATYGQNPEATIKLTAHRDSKPERAAMTVVANAMLNLDEVMTKE